MTAPSPPVPGSSRGRWLLGLTLGAAAVAVLLFLRSPPPPTPPPPPPRFLPEELPSLPLKMAQTGRITVWWDRWPADVAPAAADPGGSNIHPADYAGPESCRKCHRGNHDAWSDHPHRSMNARASEAAVLGDFSGKAAIEYRGGRATFDRQGGAYRMRLERGAVRRNYTVTQTIGSRFFQYYVGKQTEGPEPKAHHFYHKEHVLPFGYWLDEKEWVPVVHIGPEVEDGARLDPFQPAEEGRFYAEYAASCNYCHTTFALADLLGRRPDVVGRHAPQPVHWSLGPYLKKARPVEFHDFSERMKRGTPGNPMLAWDAGKYAVTMGISCEACHLGAREHVESGGRVPPRFFPSSPHLALDAGAAPPAAGRTHANVNWACGRCHVGSRPTFAAGMSTWNSVEYTDAMLGSCYSQMRCIDCHNPHRKIGARWAQPPERDDARCLQCHPKYAPEDRRRQHTRHAPGSEGSRCLNCHMPRINEGLQGLVRTHMVYSPTRADMIEANHPNACNLCHTDRPIDWTLRHLKEWYGASYNPARVAAAYPEREQPVAVGWLKSPNEAVRLVGADALARSREAAALPHLVRALDDPYLINRQFAARGLREMFGTRLGDFGYRFYQSAAERRGPLGRIEAHFLAPPARRGP